MKKLLCLLLASLLLLTATACAADGTEVDTTASPDAVTEAESEDPNFACGLPEDLTFDGAEVNILYNDENSRDEEVVSDGSGGVVSTAVHERNVLVEERLDVTLVTHPSSKSGNLSTDVQSGQGDYDLVWANTNHAIQNVIQWLYGNLTPMNYIDTSKHYWTQGYNDMVTFTDANVQFLASGPVAISMSRYMFLTIYNKELFNDYKLPDLYDVVQAGEWTLDYQYSLAHGYYVDKDGDNKPSEGDFYGFVTGDCISVDPYCVAADIHVVVKDPATKDLMYNPTVVESLSELCDKVQLLYNDGSTYSYGAAYDDVPDNEIIHHFTDGNALMATTMFLKMEQNIAELADMTYGIAPMPKLSKEQSDNYSYVQDQVSCLGVSAVVAKEKDQDLCSATLEALAYYSYLKVLPAYYETALSERYMQDPQSKEVLDYMFDTLRFDFASTCCNVLSVVTRDNLRTILSGTSNTVASSTRSWARSLERSLDTLNKNIERAGS